MEIDKLMGHLRTALNVTSSSSAPGPDHLNYGLIKAIAKTALGDNLLEQIPYELHAGRAPKDLKGSNDSKTWERHYIS